MRFTVLISVLLLTTNSYALDMREIVGGSNDTGLVKTIDPDKSIFGVPLGITEERFIEKYGKPTGYVKINATDTGMLYGKGYFFFFESGKLSGIRISHNILDWKISKEMITSTPFDRVRWKLSNGIREGMSKSEVREILKDKLKTNTRGYGSYYSTDKAKVELDFSHMVDSGDDDSAYHLYGITVRAK